MKRPVQVDRGKLTRSIVEAEKEGPLPKQGDLWKKVAEIYGDPKVTASVVYLRVKEWNLAVKTTAAKKGRRLSGGGKRRPRAEKMKAFSSNFLKMKKETPPRFIPLVVLSEQGSMRAALKLKCLDCMGFQTVEIKRCPVSGCSLYPYRPYQG